MHALPLTLAGLATAAIATGSTLTYAALSPGSQLFGRTLITAANPNQAALTYDDGPNAAATEALLDVLAAHNARATFFMIGKFVRQRSDLVRRVHAAGHLIGNHTESHPWLHRCSPAQVRDEMTRCQHALEDAIGAPVHYFRPPHGARRPAVFTVARELELKVVQWNAMGWDWEPINSDKILSNIDRGLTRARNHGVAANILLHDGWDQAMGADRSATIAATNTLLQRWAQQGIQPVTVDAWL
ncbi:polysaccharide deacetylase family protein [Granulicella sp. 5B5]|uniref:polysaccharide deacetylase family protein n=1 Tax=Granulicella sp. 5B5 TaxID=1617967 RepID=UPI0015F534DF|nr:polysaccharide deacetylase family protein [Granulicella sp. 5B5]QMV19492.1 polysaccharide deacetylase family protein [Granulicella sp. 5B5]